MVDILDNEGNSIPDLNRPGENLSYYIPPNLLNYLKKIKTKITKKDKDYVLVIDGYEGSGKSTLAQQMGKYVDPSLNLGRICMTADEFKQAIIDAQKEKCVIYDEAVTGMAASESITRIGRILKSMMMQMRQKNLFVIVIIPTIFELGRYAILSRAKALLHVYEKGDTEHRWVGYNKKDLKKLYLKGRKNYAYKVRSFFIGRFFGKWMVNEQEYRKKKEKALFLIDKVEEPGGKMYDKAIKNTNALVKILLDLKWSYRKIESKIKEAGGSLTIGMMTAIKRKYEEKHGIV